MPQTPTPRLSATRALLLRARAGVEGLGTAGIAGLVLKGVVVGLSFLFLKAVASLTGAEGLGQFSICFTVALLGTWAAKLGVDIALLRFTAAALALKQTSRLASAFGKALALSLPLALLIAALVWTLAPILSERMDQPSIEGYLHIAALWIPFWTLLYLCTEGLRGFGRTSGFLFLQSGLPYVWALLALIPAFTGHLPIFSADGPLIAYWGGLAVSSGIAAFWLWRLVRKAQAPIHNRFPFRRLTATALPIAGTTLALVVLGWADTLLLALWRPAEETGIYTAALRLSNLAVLPLQALGGLAAPQLAALYATRNLPGLRQAVRQRTLQIGGITLPLVAGICLASPWLMQVFGEAFKEGWPYLCILAAGQLFNAACGVNDHLLQMSGHERTYRNIMLSAMVFNLVFNVLFIPRFGALACALINALTNVYWNSLTLWYGRKVLR